MVSQRCTRFTTALSALALLGTITLSTPSSVQAYTRHRNWAQRHPTATGIGAAWATHHALKVSAANKKRNHRRLNWAERHPTLSGIGVGMGTHHVIKRSTR